MSWFDPKDTRRTHEHVGLVEIKQKNRLNVADVYIVAQQATQVFYLPWACQSVKNLEDWYVVYDVPPHGKLPAPNEEEDYQPHIDPDTYDGEFFQETRVAKKHFGKTSTFGQKMEVENENAEEEEEVEDEEVTDDDEEEDEEVEHEEVTDADDISLLDRLQKGFKIWLTLIPIPEKRSFMTTRVIVTMMFLLILEKIQMIPTISCMHPNFLWFFVYMNLYYLFP